MIRPIEPGDLPALLDLIRELAAYESSADSVETDVDDLRAALFADSPYVFATVATDDDRVVGAAVWTIAFSTWTGRHSLYLEDLVVTAAARQGGHGAALLRELARICAERGYRRLDWEVLDALEQGDPLGGSGPQGFYRRLGGQPRSDWTSWRLEGPALAALASEEPVSPAR